MQTTLSKDGTLLAYDVYGDEGPPLIFIAGAMCYRSFGPIRKDALEFARHCRVYLYDRRGRGDSGDTPPYSRDREIEDVDAMIAAAGGSACLYGHSSGSVLALEAAARLGGRVQKTLLYDASYVSDEAEQADFAKLSAQVLGLLEAGRNSKAMRVFLNGIGMPAIFVWLMRLMPEWKTIRALAPTLAYDIALTENPPPLQLAARIQTPLRIVVGAKSPRAIRAVGEQLAGAVSHARMLTLAGQDHNVDAKALSPILADLLEADQ